MVLGFYKISSQGVLQKAKECGIDFCVNTKDQDIGKVLMDNFGQNKADIILECVGVNTTMS